MTLQQKLLAKKSKKGFTLVELVVVIAILAILAAIAIPMVVNIIQSASDSSGASQAATLSQECKNVYAGVKSGTINSTSKASDGSAVNSWAPAKTATAGEKAKWANAVKVSEVMSYAGLKFTLGDDYWYVAGNSVANHARGDIVFFEGGKDGANNVSTTDYTKLTTDITLGAIYTGTAGTRPAAQQGN